jgi:YbbR domain-containing protein
MGWELDRKEPEKMDALKRSKTMMSQIPSKKYSRKVVLIVLGTVAVLSGSLYFFAKNAETTLPFFLEFVDIPEGLVIIDRVPTMEACIKGPNGILNTLKETTLNHDFPLTSAEPGRLQVKISPETVDTPKGTSVLEINPSSFFVRIDKRAEKSVPVVPHLENKPVIGHVVSTVTPAPSTVRLSGPASVLEKITEIQTTPIDLSGLMETTQKSVALNLDNSPHVQPLGDGLIEMTIEVEEKIVETSTLAPVSGTGTNHRYDITPDRITLVLRGPENTLKTLVNGNNIRVHIDLQGLEPGTHIRRATIEPPLNTSVVEAKPERFTVQLHK